MGQKQIAAAIELRSKVSMSTELGIRAARGRDWFADGANVDDGMAETQLAPMANADRPGFGDLRRGSGVALGADRVSNNGVLLGRAECVVAKHAAMDGLRKQGGGVGEVPRWPAAICGERPGFLYPGRNDFSTEIDLAVGEVLAAVVSGISAAVDADSFRRLAGVDVGLAHGSSDEAEATRGFRAVRQLRL